MLVLCLLPTAASASDDMSLAIGGGVDSGDGTGWAVRLGETIEVTKTDEGLIYGATCGYDYWRASTSSGFNIPMGAFVGARTHDITTAFGAGVGVLAFESNHDDDGFGVVPYLGTTLGFELAGRRTITIDARISRHVLLGADDFSRWSVLVMYGKTIGH
jgi:hypothetical protein